MAEFNMEAAARIVRDRALDLEYKGLKLREWIDLITSGDLVMQKHGKWIEDEYGYTHCSECGMEWDEPEHPPTKFCPECGALMARSKEAGS